MSGLSTSTADKIENRKTVHNKNQHAELDPISEMTRDVTSDEPDVIFFDSVQEFDQPLAPAPVLDIQTPRIMTRTRVHQKSYYA